MVSVPPLHSLILDLPPSCTEFWPLNPQYAVVGTYNLEKEPAIRTNDDEEPEKEALQQEKPQERNGSIILLKVEGDQVRIIQTLATPFAVLDIHFVLDQHPQSLFGVASSTGSLALYRLVDTEGNGLDHGTDAAVVPKVKHVQTFDVTEPSILVTAFMWLPRRRSSDGQGLNACISLTNGSISLVEIQPDSATSPPKSENIGSHDLEAWTIAATIDGMGIYSGGDDSALCLWDVPKDTDSTLSDASDCDLTPKAVWKDRKLHNAGVTAILPLPSTNSEPLLVTGSYDDCVRLISAPSIGRRKELACMNLGGGVWRLKRLNSTHRSQDDVVILASCMHAGARILNLGRDANDDEWKFEVLVKFEEHKSMNYGSDCQPYPNEAGQTTFVTTSFYDRLLCLWRY